MRKMTIVGGSNWDQFYPVHSVPQAGESTHTRSASWENPGGELATAATIAALGHPVSLISTLGDDEAGHKIREAAQRPFLDAHFITVPYPTRKVIIQVIPSGERAITIEKLPSDKELFKLTREHKQVLARTDYCWLSFIDDPELRITISRLVCGECGIPIRQLSEAVYYEEKYTLVIGSETEGMPVEEALLNVGCRFCVVTQGAAGGLYWQPQQGWKNYIAELVSNPIDLTGCGDSFRAGILYALAQSRPVKEGIVLGAWLGARCAERLGNYPPLSLSPPFL